MRGHGTQFCHVSAYFHQWLLVEQRRASHHNWFTYYTVWSKSDEQKKFKKTESVKSVSMQDRKDKLTAE